MRNVRGRGPYPSASDGPGSVLAGRPLGGTRQHGSQSEERLGGELLGPMSGPVRGPVRLARESLGLRVPARDLGQEVAELLSAGGEESPHDGLEALDRRDRKRPVAGGVDEDLATDRGRRVERALRHLLEQLYLTVKAGRDREPAVGP